jgi:CHAP domain
MASTLSTKALEIALTQEGNHENPKGSNWGHPVQDYLASVGINFPAAWCAAFCHWCFDQAAKELGVKNPIYKTGGVIAQLMHSKKYLAKPPQAGDLGIMEFSGGKGHMFFVVDANPKIGTITTLEGNSNDDGSREGWEVVKRTRRIDTIHAFLRF